MGADQIFGRIDSETVENLGEEKHKGQSDKDMWSNVETREVFWECLLPFLNIHV